MTSFAICILLAAAFSGLNLSAQNLPGPGRNPAGPSPQTPGPSQDSSLENGAAKLLSMVGQVSVLHDDQPWALNVGDFIQVQQVVITGPDGFAVFQVADGSTFEVYPKSRVVFRNNRSDWKDLLDVFLGRVKVHIEKLGGVPNHNKIHTPTAVISVRGTTFDVDVEDENATTLVLVEEGQVEVRHLLKSGIKVLNPGEFVRVYKDQPLEASYIDKGAALRRAMRSASDALYQVLLNQSPGHAGSSGGTSGGTTSTGGATGGSPGDKNGNGTPPPPPPPAPHP